MGAKLDQVPLLKVLTLNTRMAKQIDVAPAIQGGNPEENIRAQINAALYTKDLHPLGWAQARMVHPSASYGEKYWLVEFGQRFYWIPTPRCYSSFNGKHVPQIFV